ncbi:Tubby-like F-box protein 3, partial [Mucuna pruriens]
MDALDQSWWANIPHHLLREVLLRIESSESTWPPRRTVVACAGVCRTWRLIVKEIVKPPQLSSIITFPISLKQPGPREHLLKCFIRRNSGTQTYYLFLSISSALADDGKFLLAARKFRRPTCTDYIISLDADMSRESNAYVGKLRCTLNRALLPLLFLIFMQRLTRFSSHLIRSNFLGTKFTVYDSQLHHAGAKITRSPSTKLVNPKQVSSRVPTGNYPVAHISYELNVLGSRGPRRMHCVMDTIPASVIEPGGIPPSQTDFSVSNIDTSSFPLFQTNSTSLQNSISGHQSNKKDDVLVLRNKAARWHEQLQCWCLNFHGRVTVASVKNFQLAALPENGLAGPQEGEEVILQFGKVGKDLFTMDYGYPISAFQAFAICLSSFATT